MPSASRRGGAGKAVVDRLSKTMGGNCGDGDGVRTARIGSFQVIEEVGGGLGKIAGRAEVENGARGLFA